MVFGCEPLYIAVGIVLRAVSGNNIELSIKGMSCPKTDCPKKCVFLFIVVLRCSEHKATKKV